MPVIAIYGNNNATWKFAWTGENFHGNYSDKTSIIRVGWRRVSTKKKTHNSLDEISILFSLLFLDQDQTVNHEYYKDVLQRLCERIRKKRLDSWFIHHDSTLIHSALRIWQFCSPQPPYSPYLIHYDLFILEIEINTPF